MPTKILYIFMLRCKAVVEIGTCQLTSRAPCVTTIVTVVTREVRQGGHLTIIRTTSAFKIYRYPWPLY